MAVLKLYASIKPGEGKIRFKLTGLSQQWCDNISFSLFKGIDYLGGVSHRPMLMYYGSTEYEANFNISLDLGETYMVQTTVYDSNGNVSSGPLQASIDIPGFSVATGTDRVDYSISGMDGACAAELEAELFQGGNQIGSWSDSSAGGFVSYGGWFSALSAGTAYDLFINTSDDGGEVRYEFYAGVTTQAQTGPVPYIYQNGAWREAEAHVVSGGAFQQTTPNIS